MKKKHKFLLYLLLVCIIGVPAIGGVATGIFGEMQILQFVLENPSHLPFYILYVVLCVGFIIFGYYYVQEDGRNI